MMKTVNTNRKCLLFQLCALQTQQLILKSEKFKSYSAVNLAIKSSSLSRKPLCSVLLRKWPLDPLVCSRVFSVGNLLSQKALLCANKLGKPRPTAFYSLGLRRWPSALRMLELHREYKQQAGSTHGTQLEHSYPTEIKS